MNRKYIITPEHEEFIRDNAKNMNISMLAKALKLGYYSVYHYVEKHRIQTSTVRKDARQNAGITRKQTHTIKPGYFDWTAESNWII